MRNGVSLPAIPPAKPGKNRLQNWLQNRGKTTAKPCEVITPHTPYRLAPSRKIGLRLSLAVFRLPLASINAIELGASVRAPLSPPVNECERYAASDHDRRDGLQRPVHNSVSRSPRFFGEHVPTFQHRLTCFAAGGAALPFRSLASPHRAHVGDCRVSPVAMSSEPTWTPLPVAAPTWPLGTAATGSTSIFHALCVAAMPARASHCSPKE